MTDTKQDELKPFEFTANGETIAYLGDNEWLYPATYKRLIQVVPDLMIAWHRLSAPSLSTAQAGEAQPAVPGGFFLKHVEGHGWIVYPPNREKWVAFEGTPAGDFMHAMFTAQSQQKE
jgi:hypothetical protein